MTLSNEPAAGAAEGGTAPDSTTTQTPAVVQQDGGGEGQGAAAPKPELTAEQREIRNLQRKLSKAHGHNSRLSIENETLRRSQSSTTTARGAQPQPPAADEGQDHTPQEPTFTPQQVREFMQQQRAQEQSAAALTEQVSRAVAEGRKSIKDFDQKCNRLLEAHDLIDAQGKPAPLLEAILDCDRSHEVIEHLDANPELAEEIADLTPKKQIRRLAQLESELASKPKTSAAPKPLSPVNGASSGSKPDDKLTDAEWAEKRAAERRASGGRR